MTALNRRALTFLLATVFLDLIGIGILAPVTPYIVRQFNTDALTVGLLSLSFSAAQFTASPVLGVLSDRYGRRPVLLLSIVGTGVGYFIFGWANTLWLLYVSRLLDGFTGGNVSTAQAYIADVTPPEDRAKTFGLLGAAFGLGFILGPAVGGALSHISLRAPAYAAGVLSFATALFGYFALPESLHERRSGPVSWGELNPFRPIGAALGNPPLRTLLAAIFCLSFAASALQTNFAVLTLERFGFTADQNAWLFAYIGLIVVITQGWLVRRLLPRFGERRLALAGLGIAAAGFVMTAVTHNPRMLYVCMTLFAAGTGLASPTLTGLVSRRVPADEQGAALGTSQSLMSLARAGGPAWAGAVYDWFGQGAPYSTGAAWLLGSMGLVALAREPGFRQEDEARRIGQRE